MGDYGRMADDAATTNSTLNRVFLSYQNHMSGKRTDTELAVTELIRMSHPDHEPIRTMPRSCDIIAWAKAGQANLRLRTESRHVLVNRGYEPADNRMEGGEGKLGEDVLFGLYDLEFESQKFEFYSTSWSEAFRGTIKTNYVLASKRDIDAGGHSASVDRLLMVVGKWTSDLHNEIYVFDDGDWEKNAKLWTSVQSSYWEDVILDPGMKETLISDVTNFFDSRAIYDQYSVPWKRGIILHGTPGCGKTISIKALVNALGKRPFPVASLYVKTLENCNGGHYAIRSIFNLARKMAPCMLIFEDLDSLVVDKVRSYFLNEVDGLEDNNGILMIGSTNHLERLDPGISKRPSRFDRKYHFELPGEKERVQYCLYWKNKLEQNSNVDFDRAICDVVAELTEGFSFAYLKELFVQTLLTLVGGRHRGMTDEEVAEDAQVVDDSAKVLLGDESVSANTEDQSTQTDAENKHMIPAEAIPEALKDNTLMQILRKQIVSLRREMDNSKVEDAKDKKKAHGEGQEV